MLFGKGGSGSVWISYLGNGHLLGVDSVDLSLFGEGDKRNTHSSTGDKCNTIC